MSEESGRGGSSGADSRDEQSVDDAVSALGPLFEGQRLNAQRLIDELAAEHSDLSVEKKVRHVKARAVRRLSDLMSAHEEVDVGQLREAVAELAVAIALLRGIEPRSTSEFAELGARVMRSVEKTADRHQRIGGAVPNAAAGFERVARQLQPIVAELLFKALGGAKPARPGVARDAYKSMRSTVWRARHDREVTAATANAAAAAVSRAIDAAAPRLIVRMVDKSLD